GTFNDLEKTRQVLMGFLDRISGATDLVSAYSEIMDVWLAERDAREHFDWRYYLVKYPAMRSGWSGQYMSEDGEPGYRLCMLKRTRMTSYYLDPYRSCPFSWCTGFWRSFGFFRRRWPRDRLRSPPWFRCLSRVRCRPLGRRTGLRG